ncbi:ATP-binding protein [Dethiothermospora halolimnae]|uniref:ATP-binding protein n=1 Tax=Dethiothermospora halolimnae TaxID=3114390 RepID=UPI003CCBEAB0
MRINRFKSDCFGGIKDRDVQFNEGLNVILGPNEAGKSTFINGIYNTIFKKSKLNLRSKDDKEFKNRFMPYPNGDSINGKVHLYVEGKEYALNKEWGESPSSFLELPDGSLIKNKNKIDENIKGLLKFGQGTYETVVFAKQRDIKKAVEKILSSSETTENITSILRKAIMELDGISVDRLNDKINNELDNLLKRWDYDNSCPENNRDIHNPYKIGVGEILKAYYNKRKIEVKMDNAINSEKKFESITKEIEILKEKIDKLEREKTELSALEGDIFKRSSLEPEIKMLNNEIQILKELNSKWPKKEMELEFKREELKRLNTSMEKLQEEYELSSKMEEKKILIKKISKVEESIKRLEELKNKKDSLQNITKEDIKSLERHKSIMERSNATIEAATLKANIIKKSDYSINLIKGLDNKEEVTESMDFIAKGYMKLEVEGILDLEIKSGEIDFEEISNKYNSSKEEYCRLLKKLNIKNIEEGKLILSKLEDINKDIEITKNHMENQLDGHSYSELNDKLDKLKDINNIRDKKEIQLEINTTYSKISDIKANIKSIEDLLNEWEVKYGDSDELFDKITDINLELKEKSREIKKLKPLPEGFDSANDFKIYFRKLTDNLDDLKKDYSGKVEIYYQCENSLSDVSYEELKEQYKDAEREYNKLINRVKNLKIIKERFDKITDTIANTTFEPLVKSFSKYLSKITRNKYEVGNIDDNFNVNIGSKDINIPVNLLSAGTYDSVALALRFAILENLYKDSDGFMILDDCLVDLDPNRKNEAVEVIKEFAKKNQVIFTTCSPDTAKLLGGNIINF